MAANLIPVRNFLIKWILPPITVIMFLIALLDALFKTFLWPLIQPSLNANASRLFSLFSASKVAVQVDAGGFSIVSVRVIIIACLLILLVKNTYIRHLKFWLASLPFLGILLVDYLSRYWSVASAFSVSRYFYLGVSVVAGIYIGLECNKSKIIWLLEAFSILILFGNLWAVYKQPGFAIMTGPLVDGAWRGLFWWKGYAGEITAFAAILFLFRLLDFKKNRWFMNAYGLVFYLLAIFLLIRAKSATELLALVAAHFVAAAALAYLKWGHNLKPKHWWALGGVSVVLLAAAWFERGALLGLIGRNESLTGRVPLWEALLPFIQKRFWLGYGFGEAFWKNDSLTQVVWKAIIWNAPHAHNGFIEALLDTGIVGLVLWVLFIIQVSYYSVRYILREHVISATIFFAWIAYIVVSNLADNMLASYEYFTLFLLVITFAFLIRGEFDKKKSIQG